MIKTNLYHLHSEAEAPVLQGLNGSEFTSYVRVASALPMSNRLLAYLSAQRRSSLPYFKPKSLSGHKKAFIGDSYFSPKVKLRRKRTQKLPVSLVDRKRTTKPQASS